MCWSPAGRGARGRRRAGRHRRRPRHARSPPSHAWRSSPRCSCSPRRRAPPASSTGGALLPRGPHTSVRRLLVAISLAAVAVTTVMSLDATAVLFTPVVDRARPGAAHRLGAAAARDHAARQRVVEPPAGVEPHQPARVLGHRPDLRWLRGPHGPPDRGGVGGRRRGSSAGVLAARGTMEPDAVTVPAPRLDGFARFVIAASLVVLFVAFFVVSQLGGEPAWAAAVGAGVLAIATIVSRRDSPRVVPRRCRRRSSSSSWARRRGRGRGGPRPGDAARDLLPGGDGSGPCWPSSARRGPGQPGEQHARHARAAPVMAAGSTGSCSRSGRGQRRAQPHVHRLAGDLLWRRVVRAEDLEPSRGAFFRLALLATPLALVLSTSRSG